MLAGARRSSAGRCGRISCRRLRRGSGRRWDGLWRLDLRWAQLPAARLLGVIRLEVPVVEVVVVGVDHWVHTVPRARCARNVDYRFGAEDRLDVEAEGGQVAADAEAAGDAEDSDMPYSIPVVAVEAGRDRPAADNAGRKGVNMEVEVEAEAAVAVGFATAHAPWMNHWGVEEALLVLRDWQLAHMALREEVASSMGLFWLQAWLRVVQRYEGDMGGIVYEREKMEREYTTLAAPVESFSEQRDTDYRVVRENAVQCETVLYSAR
jgi:hypothetical protein